MDKGSSNNISEAMKAIRNKADLHESAMRNDWHVPPLKSTIVTVKWLKAIINGKLWCPKYAEIRLRPCPTPPPKELIVHELL